MRVGNFIYVVGFVLCAFMAVCK